MRKSLAAIARSAICPPFARRSEQSTAPSTLRPDAPDGRGVRAPLPAGVRQCTPRCRTTGQTLRSPQTPEPDRQLARPTSRLLCGHHGCRSGRHSRRPRGAVAQETILSPSGPFSDSSGGSAVARRPGQRTLVLVLLPSTLGSPARLHGVVARASGCHRHVFAIAERPAMQGRGLPTLASLRGPRTVEPPRYASTAPVALVRGSCVMPGPWGFP
jgi:hypothetical protein